MKIIENYYNLKVKKYGKSEQVIVYSKPIIVGNDSPLKGLTKDQIIKKTKGIYDYKIKALMSYKRSNRRSKNMIFDYSRSNDWQWFLTLTFDPEKVDSFNYELCTKKLSQWLNNIRKRHCPDMKYVFVPELHKSGRYHFHGIMSDCEGLEFVDSGHVTKNGQVIYNVGKYRFGFTTATKVVDSQKVSMYLAKYVTKELASLTKGKRRYWHSRNCNVPEIEYYYNGYDSDEVPGGKNKHDVLMDIHGSLINKEGFVYGDQKDYIDSKGKEQFIRYYEYMEG
ncbi:MAG: hypothetical protein QXI16_07785 [Sulfolobaceae archaeon]